MDKQQHHTLTFKGNEDNDKGDSDSELSEQGIENEREAQRDDDFEFLTMAEYEARSDRTQRPSSGQSDDSASSSWILTSDEATDERQISRHNWHHMKRKIWELEHQVDRVHAANLGIAKKIENLEGTVEALEFSRKQNDRGKEFLHGSNNCGTNEKRQQAKKQIMPSIFSKFFTSNTNVGHIPANQDFAIQTHDMKALDSDKFIELLKNHDNNFHQAMNQMNQTMSEQLREHRQDMNQQLREHRQAIKDYNDDFFRRIPNFGPFIPKVPQFGPPTAPGAEHSNMNDGVLYADAEFYNTGRNEHMNEEQYEVAHSIKAGKKNIYDDVPLPLPPEVLGDQDQRALAALAVKAGTSSNIMSTENVSDAYDVVSESKQQNADDH